MNNKGKIAAQVLTSIIFAASLTFLIYFVVLQISFYQNVTSYLQGAADANSVQLALDRMTPALNFLEETNRTEGYSHLLIKTEKVNVGFWYDNLVSAKKDVEEASNRTLGKLEESNLLLKLRETILNNDGNVTKPSHIVLYPNQRIFIFFIVLSVLAMPISFAMLLHSINYLDDILGDKAIELIIIIAIISIMILSLIVTSVN